MTVTSHEWNVFEDPRAVIREGGWLRVVHQSERLPDGYGVAWRLMDSYEAVVAPLPWHRVYGWAYRTYWRWRMAVTPTLKDQIFELGREQATAEAAKRETLLRTLHARELERAVAAAEVKGYDRGARHVIADIQREMRLN